ncbi:MAG: NAD(P)H-hydrate epimerase, partial [Bacteroidetes bacterium]|nr:NAD(P)H-hydrate epimerase [Bacteroidota bacterium]
MPLIFFGEKMIPLYSTDQIRKADEFAVKKLGIPSLLLMENAARSLFAIIMNNYPDLNPLDKIGIVCGKGNNGGDGFALARNFMNMGFSVSVIALCPKSELAGDALTNHNILVNLLKYNQDSSFSYYKNLSDLNKLKNCSVIIDAILGTGIKGEIKGKFEKVIDKLNDMEGIKIAIDVPSGLDMNTSTGSTIFFSDLTITLAKQKTELVYGMGFVHSGEVAVGTIGLGAEYFDYLEVDDYLIEPEDVYGVLKLKELDVHKYSSGKVFVIAGSYHYTGAAVLTAEA